MQGTGLVAQFTSARTATVVDPNVGNNDVVTVAGAIPLVAIEIAGSNAGQQDAPYQTPDSSAYISTEQIDRLPPVNAGDLFRSTAGVIASGNRVGASMNLNIRGLQGQSRVNVMVDGTRMSNDTYRGYQGNRSEVFVDPDFLAGISINKGPFGGVGGVGVMGGVVNMRTIEATDIVREGKTFGVRIKAGLGSNTVAPPAVNTTAMRFGSPDFNGEAWSGSIVGAVAKDNYEFLIGYSRRTSGNYFAGSKGKSTFFDDRSSIPPTIKPLSPYGPGREVFNSSQDVTSFILKGKVSWGDGHSLETGYINYKNIYGENNETFLGFAFTFFPASEYPLNKIETHTYRASYKYDPAGNDLIKFSANVWKTDLNNFVGAIPVYSAVVHSNGGDLSNTSQFDTLLGRLALKNGVEFVLEQARAADSTNPGGNRLMLSAFNQSKLDLTSWLSVSGGLRIDRYESEGKHAIVATNPERKGERINPSMSVTLEPVKGIQFFGSYIEGWRPPSLRETASSVGGQIVPNLNLMPELSKNFEFGLNVMRSDLLVADDKVRFKAVRFDNNYNDYIVRTPAPWINPTAYTWRNVDRAKFRGYEFSANYDAGSFFIESSFTKYDKVGFCHAGRCGDAVAGADYGIQNVPPKYSGNFTGGVRLLDRRLTLGARAYFFGQRFGGYKIAPGAAISPVFYYSNTIVDLFGSYKFSETLSVDFSVENLADRYYVDAMATAIVASPGRTARLSATARF